MRFVLQQASSTSEGGEGELVVGYMPSLDQLASLTQQGNMDLSTLNKVYHFPQITHFPCV